MAASGNLVRFRASLVSLVVADMLACIRLLPCPDPWLLSMISTILIRWDTNDHLTATHDHVGQ